MSAFDPFLPLAAYRRARAKHHHAIPIERAAKPARMAQNVLTELSERNVIKADETTIVIATTIVANHNRPSKSERYEAFPLPYARNCRPAAEKKPAAAKPTAATTKGLGILDLRCATWLTGAVATFHPFLSLAVSLALADSDPRRHSPQVSSRGRIMLGLGALIVAATGFGIWKVWRLPLQPARPAMARVTDITPSCFRCNPPKDEIFIRNERGFGGFGMFDSEVRCRVGDEVPVRQQGTHLTPLPNTCRAVS